MTTGGAGETGDDAVVADSGVAGTVLDDAMVVDGVVNAASPSDVWDGETTADEGIARMYESQWRPLVRLVWLLLRDQGAAEDVAQDAFVATYRAWGTLRDRGAAVAYLRRCAVNGARSRIRHEIVVRRENEAEAGRAEAVGRAVADAAEEAALARLDGDRLAAELENLPQRQREVVVLRYYGDLSEAHIADALGISPGSVKTHASRGLRALRDRLEATP